jgi:hypothetical protein
MIHRGVIIDLVLCIIINEFAKLLRNKIKKINHGTDNISGIRKYITNGSSKYERNPDKYNAPPLTTSTKKNIAK